MPIRILLVDDHAVARQGLKTLLGLDKDLEVSGEATDGRQALQMARDLKPDVVLNPLLCRQSLLCPFSLLPGCNG